MSEKNEDQDDTIVIKRTKKLKERKVDIDGEMHTVRELTGDEQAAWNDWMKSRVDRRGALKTSKGFYAKLLSMSVRGPDGNLLSQSYITANWPSSLQTEIHDIADQLSLLTKKAQEEADASGN